MARRGKEGTRFRGYVGEEGNLAGQRSVEWTRHGPVWRLAGVVIGVTQTEGPQGTWVDVGDTCALALFGRASGGNDRLEVPTSGWIECPMDVTFSQSPWRNLKTGLTVEISGTLTKLRWDDRNAGGWPLLVHGTVALTLR